jgi:hypothetical protein
MLAKSVSPAEKQGSSSMTETSDTVYAAGWRQGTVLQADISVLSTVLNTTTGGANQVTSNHSLWALVTQDCNLYRTKASKNSPSIEFRQVHDSDPPAQEGIRARKFLLNPELGHYLIDDKPSAFVSPRFLCDSNQVALRYKLSEARVLALKTWLGNRYDRPAVPDELVPLAKAIAESVQRNGKREFADQVREIYMRFEEASGTVKFSLFGVIFDKADAPTIREWLANCVLEVSHELGIPAQIEAVKSSQISFDTIETSYCADVSQLTWMGEEVAGL